MLWATSSSKSLSWAPHWLNFAGLPDFDGLKILPAGEAGCVWAKAYSKLLTPAGFVGKIKEVLAANADAYAEEVENTAAAMLKAL